MSSIVLHNLLLYRLDHRVALTGMASVALPCRTKVRRYYSVRASSSSIFTVQRYTLFLDDRRFILIAIPCPMPSPRSTYLLATVNRLYRLNSRALKFSYIFLLPLLHIRRLSYTGSLVDYVGLCRMGPHKVMKPTTLTFLEFTLIKKFGGFLYERCCTKFVAYNAIKNENVLVQNKIKIRI